MQQLPGIQPSLALLSSHIFLSISLFASGMLDKINPRSSNGLIEYGNCWYCINSNITPPISSLLVKLIRVAKLFGLQSSMNVTDLASKYNRLDTCLYMGYTEERPNVNWCDSIYMNSLMTSTFPNLPFSEHYN